ncbi:aminopeptidase [Mycobacterium kubicae]|uniref:aminopeptidase n=1 Tax=Mycobacterium kubicae TaxID=120959 RepID=UPI0007FD22EC|nr:aminopeptidase [Mycobacterium kubicae]OBK50896.1 aminopeptidase [Mycobacterium kubicae]
MTVRRLILAVSAVLLLAGVIGLLVPVTVDNSNGGKVSCGNGIAADMSSARNANDKTGANIPILNQVLPHTDYVAQCQSAVSGRRTWTIPLAVIGLAGVGAALLLRRNDGIGTRAPRGV